MTEPDAILPPAARHEREEEEEEADKQSSREGEREREIDACPRAFEAPNEDN